MRNCVTRNKGMNKHHEMKKNIRNFFRYGFKIFYPICCSRKRSADTSTLYIKKKKFNLKFTYVEKIAVTRDQGTL